MTFLANGDNQNMHTHHLDIHKALSPEKKGRKVHEGFEFCSFGKAWLLNPSNMSQKVW